MGSKNRLDPWDEPSNLPSLQQALAQPPHLPLWALGRLQSREAGRNSKDHPHTGQGTNRLKTQFLPISPPSPPPGLESGPTSAEQRRPPPST